MLSCFSHKMAKWVWKSAEERGWDLVEALARGAKREKKTNKSINQIVKYLPNPHLAMK